MYTTKLRVDSVRQVFNDGHHNAFTDVCRFRERFYLTFRSCPDGHGVFASSKILVLSSEDASQWTEAFSFSAPNRDVRDPHFLIYNETLFTYTGTWLCDPARPGHRDINDHLGYAAWSVDGVSWNGPRFLEGTYGHYIWRAAAHGNKAYLCGRRKQAFAVSDDSGDGTSLTQSAMLESEDGLVWRFRSLFTEAHGDETAFLFEEDGSILAVHRTGGTRPAQVCRSRPPYVEWTRVDLDRYIGGPLLAKWGDRYLVAGRHRTSYDEARTAVYWLVEDRLIEAAKLPSGGDNSYPGFVALSDTQGLLSYYSSHEGSGDHNPPSNIYLAELSISC